MGDAMGMAILFCPLFLWFSSSGPYDRKRALAVSLLSLFLLVFFVPLYMLVVNRHEEAYYERVGRDASELVQRIESIRNQNEGVVTSLSTIKGSVPTINSDAFRYITAPLMKEFPAIKAFEWAPRVRVEDRLAFESEMRDENFPDFSIFQKEADDLDPKLFAGKSTDYFPVSFVSPLDGNENAIGLDLASEPHRAEALFDCIENNRRSTTKPIVLVQELKAKSYSYLTFSPVFPRGTTDPKECVGVIVGVFRFDDIIEAAMGKTSAQNFDFVLRDRRQPETVVFSSFVQTENIENTKRNREAAYLTLALSHDSPWQVQIFPSIGIYDFSNWWQIWLILFGGVVLVYLGVNYFTIISAQPELVKRKIEEKTLELQTSSESLKQLNDELEVRVADRTAELTESNKELNLFVSAVSHDLRAPLAKLNMFVTSLHKSYSGKEPSVDTAIALGAIDNATHSMTHLISGMLDLSRKSNQAMEIEQVSLDEIIHQVLVDLEDDIKTSRITIDWEPLPVVMGDTVLLTQLYYNLLSNAIKFTKESAHPNVKISMRNSPKKDEVVLTLEDNGIGIPSDRRKEVFTAFSRVHSDGSYSGSGIGLSICERIVKRLKGRIWVEDSSLGGAKFCFILKTGDA
jgi:signal transduction histidine kinase